MIVVIHHDASIPSLYINAQNFRHQKIAKILITSALTEVVNYAVEYKKIWISPECNYCELRYFRRGLMLDLNELISRRIRAR